jgi:hypothetical protein
MAYADKRTNVKLPQYLVEIIMAKDLPTKSLTARTIWLLRQQLKRLPKAGEKALESKK